MPSPTEHIIRVEPDRAVAPLLRGTIAVMGNLDGVHRGHQYLIKAAIAHKKNSAEKLAAIIFDPHPRALFTKDTPPFLLTNITQRADLLHAHGINHIFVLLFSHAMAALSPRRFVDDVLVRTLGVRHVVVGAEFQFGRGRSGSAATLAELGTELNLGVTIVTPSINVTAGEKFSSSQARSALRAGDPVEAARILGQPWSVRGCVEHGRQLGRKLNFPTANIPITDLVRPKKGVYAVTLSHNGDGYKGVANFGDRPTVDGTNTLLEVHIFDFNKDIYNQEIEVFFHNFIREEQKFDHLDQLKAQISKDCLKARDLLIHSG